MALGRYRFHRINVAAAGALNIVLPYTTAEQAALYKLDGFVQVFPEVAGTSGNEVYKLDATAQTAPVANARPDDGTLKTVTWPYTLTTNGYFWIIIDVSVRTTAIAIDAQNSNGWPLAPAWASYTFPWRLNYFTEVYSCPNSQDYPDVTGIFRGCTYAADLSKLPCVSYNNTIGACQACYTGYTLTNGRCL